MVAIVYPNYAASEYSNSWSLNDASAILPPQLLIENGMAVFLPDLYTVEDDLVTAYAGEFTLAINAAIESGRVDEVRVGAMGHSFGGYLVNCLIAQISTLKAAVSSGSWGNLSTLWGTSYSRAGGALLTPMECNLSRRILGTET